MKEPASHSGFADLTNCDREPIHIPAAIQPHGVLLVIDPASLKVIQFAGDVKRLLGLDPETILGRGVDTLVTSPELERLRTLAAQDITIPRSTFEFEMMVERGAEALDAIVHQSDGALVVELEPRSGEPPKNPLTLVQGMIARVQSAPDAPGFMRAVTDEARAATGFDRVMIYRFLPDESGEVVAESKQDDLEPMFGLHFPASDIPKQARDLYLRNRMRIIPDARYTPAPLTPVLNPLTGEPLDLSYAALRSVSPLHLEYLANMGVAASMSLSLVFAGRLWGLIACHHRTPRHVSQTVRAACELFAELVSLQLSEKLAIEAQTDRLRMRGLHAGLVEAMVGQDNLGEALIQAQPNLLDYIPAAGVAVRWEGKVTRLGEAPTDEQVERLVAWLNESAPDGVFMSDSLSSQFPPAKDYADVASGLLAISVSRAPRDYVLWFRPEASRAVNWAGNPAKPIDFAEDGVRISPRKSFAAWEEIVRDHSLPWSDAITDAAQSLRVSILEVVLRHQDKIMREREQTSHPSRFSYGGTRPQGQKHVGDHASACKILGAWRKKH